MCYVTPSQPPKSLVGNLLVLFFSLGEKHHHSYLTLHLYLVSNPLTWIVKCSFPLKKPLGGKDLTIGSVLCVPGGMGVVEIERFYLK